MFQYYNNEESIIVQVAVNKMTVQINSSLYTKTRAVDLLK